MNASPVITLAKIGRLDLLAAPRREVLLPEAVAREILAGVADDPPRIAIEGGALATRAVADVPAAIVEWSLGADESAVIALALARGATAVLDDFEARACAKSVDVAVIGTLGVAPRAKREGRIEAAVPVIRALRTAGLRLDDALVRTALERVAGEHWNG